MDKIVVLQQGRVVEIGNHKTLLAKNGVYARMWADQNGLSVSEDGSSLGISIERLRSIRFFAHLPDSTLSAIGDAMHTEVVEQGQVLLREGKRPDKFYILVRGTVAMSVKGLDGRESITRRLQSGDIFGEFALLPDLIQVDTATTTSACACLTLRRESFLRIFGSETALRDETEKAIRNQLESKLDILVEGQAEKEGVREVQPAPA